MSIDIGTLWAVVVGILGALGIVAGSVAYLRATASKASIEALRGDRDDLQHRVDIVEGELAAEKKKTADLTQRLDAETERRKILEDLVTSRAEVERVLGLLEARTPRFDEIETHLRNIETTLDTIKQAVLR